LEKREIWEGPKFHTGAPSSVEGNTSRGKEKYKKKAAGGSLVAIPNWLPKWEPSSHDAGKHCGNQEKGERKQSKKNKDNTIIKKKEVRRVAIKGESTQILSFSGEGR
jgi:microsomal dipeptidase-like Zn-dependent dipeptidase